MTGKTIYPDIIVHRRGERDNLLLIEVKKSTNTDTAIDNEKLHHLTLPDGDYGYACGLHLILDCEGARLSNATVYFEGEKSGELTAWFCKKVGLTS